MREMQRSSRGSFSKKSKPARLPSLTLSSRPPSLQRKAYEFQLANHPDRLQVPVQLPARFVFELLQARAREEGDAGEFLRDFLCLAGGYTVADARIPIELHKHRLRVAPGLAAGKREKGVWARSVFGTRE
jgi:hypothetical protein